MSEAPGSKVRGKGGGQVATVAFALWLLLINGFYYLQFRGLFLARFGSWIHRWR
jgi:hypothetical protein